MEVLALGEMLVEVMRKQRDVPHSVTGEYLGPYPSGAPAIFADAAARLGLDTAMIGVVGDDDFGELLLGRLRKDGVDVSAVRVARGYTTGIAFVMYYSSGERKFLFHLKQSAAAQLAPADVTVEQVSRSKIVHIMGSALTVSEGSMRACHRAIELAAEAGVDVTFDPNLRPELLEVSKIRELCLPVMRSSEVVLPSRTEATALVGKDEPVEAAKDILKLGPKLAVIKLGDEGSLAASSSGEIVRVPAYRANEVDPTGAGDVFDAAFALGHLRGFDLPRCLSFANAAGALKVQGFGPMEGPASANEVWALVEKGPQ